MAFGSNSTKLDFSITCIGDGRAVGIPSNLKFLGDVFGGKALSLMAFGSNSTKLDFSITCIGDGRAVGIPSNLKFL
ncbi:hypothetical protein DM01DRAFT_1371874 [Hesseltinella vesiculosa]|uniref:Uncharacterized protein n=1 Tax=Hesseltinella vesiculosa TaxID=101127 RepID=A0A1X2GQA5_9FUNG|nr:hypothetical protein DM01DRAFT_1371874 [Hesseltinella vesiculosa]